MNLKELKEIINSGLSEEVTKSEIINCLARDKNVIPTIMRILERERVEKNELILDQNAELSRALIVLSDDNLNPSKKVVCEPKWVVEEIKKHYRKWNHIVKCNFKVLGLD